MEIAAGALAPELAPKPPVAGSRVCRSLAASADGAAALAAPPQPPQVRKAKLPKPPSQNSAGMQTVESPGCSKASISHELAIAHGVD